MLEIQTSKEKMKKDIKKIINIIILIIVIIATFAVKSFAAENESGASTGKTAGGTTGQTGEGGNSDTSSEATDNGSGTAGANNQTSNSTQEQPTPVTPAQTPTTPATPTTQPTQQSTTQKNTTSTTTNNTQVKKPATKSSNANLSNLGINPNDFSGFMENKTTYDVIVPNNVKEVEVYATKKDSRATVTGTGKVQLKEGDNSTEVVVIAEDGTTKTYTINIKRLKPGEKATTESHNSELVLATLEIKGVNLEPNFNSDKYQYIVKIDGETTKLDITAKANKTGATIKIIGNENLVNGQNVITILVADEKETNITTYQILVNKNMVEQEELNNSIKDATIKHKIITWSKRIVIVLSVIFVILILVLINRKRKSKKHKIDDKKNKISSVNIKQNKTNNSRGGRHSKK